MPVFNYPRTINVKSFKNPMYAECMCDLRQRKDGAAMRGYWARTKEMREHKYGISSLPFKCSHCGYYVWVVYPNRNNSATLDSRIVRVYDEEWAVIEEQEAEEEARLSEREDNEE